MTKAIKTILLIVGVVLVIYGVYNLIAPEASVDLGIVKAEVQDNTNSYITIGLGLTAIVLTLLARKN